MEVFLIDFGMTGMHAAGLDYAELEASIRFKLLDFSISPQILDELDQNPLAKFDSATPENPMVEGAEKAVETCYAIREKYLNDFEGYGKSTVELKLQYLCCLFAICLRKTKYDDLNRQYVLRFLSKMLLPLSNQLIG